MPEPSTMLVGEDGLQITQGEEIIDFRGDPWVFQYLHKGKVVVTSPRNQATREFYLSVFPRYELQEV